MRPNKFYLLSMHISWHKYARLKSTFTKLKIKKKSISISRRSRGHSTSNQKIKLQQLFKSSFEQKISDKNAHVYSWRHFVKKIENNFFLATNRPKLRSLDSESKSTSGCSNSLFSKKKSSFIKQSLSPWNDQSTYANFKLKNAGLLTLLVRKNFENSFVKKRQIRGKRY